MKIVEISKQIAAVAALISIVFGGYFFIENRYTLQTAFNKLEQRVSIEELNRQLRQAEEEAAYYRKLLRKYPDDDTIKEKLKKAEKRVAELEEKIKELE